MALKEQINIELCNEISNGFTLPEGYTWDLSMENGKKEGKVVAYDEERMIFAELQYHEDKLNGYCCFYEDGVLKEKICYEDDIANGWSYTVVDGKETLGFLYENGRNTKKLFKKPDEEYWYEQNIENEKNYIVYKLDQEMKRVGYGYIYMNDKIVKVVKYENGKEIGIWKEFSDERMKEYNEKNQLVYEGEFEMNMINQYPRSGKGKAYQENNVIYDGEWSCNKPHGIGKEYTPTGETLHAGEWYHGLFVVNEEKVYDYETKKEEKMKCTIRCFDDFKSIDHRIPKLIIPANCCNEREMKEMFLSNFPNLSMIEIGSNSCRKVKEVNWHDLDALKSITIGRDCFKKNGRFIVTDCKEFTHLTFGPYSCNAMGFGIENLPKLTRLEIGTMEEGSNFLSAYFIINCMLRD